MVLDVAPESILNETDLRALEYGLVEHAKQLAILGEVDTARELIGLLLTVGSLSKYTVVPLSWAWKETGKWPRGSTEENKSDDILLELRKDWEENYWGQGFPGVPAEYQRFDQEGLEACLAIPERAIREGNLDTQTGWLAMEKSVRLTKALDISIRLSEPGDRVEKPDRGPGQKRSKVGTGEALEKERDEEDDWVQLPALDSRSSEILNMIVGRWNANQQVEYLSMAERLYPLFISGVVAETMGVDKKELQEKATRLHNLYIERFANAYAATPLARKSMREILTIANDNSLAIPAERRGMEPDEVDDEQDDMPNTMFNEPASPETIASLEKRLDIALPDDYIEFLTISNGFGVFDMVDGIFNGCFPDPALYAAEDVNWNSEEYFQLPIDLLQLPREIEDLGEMQEKGVFNFDTALPVFDRVLEIGTRDIDNLWLVRPESVQKAREVYQRIYDRASPAQKRVVERAMEAFAGSREAFDRLEWCCAKWSAGGSADMTFYSSFRRYLEITTMASMEDKMGDEEAGKEEEEGKQEDAP